MKKQLDEVKKLQKIAGLIKENVNEAQGMSPIEIDALMPISKLNQSKVTAEEFEAAIPFLQKIGIQVKPQPAVNPGEQEWIVQYGDQQELYMYDGDWYGNAGGYAEP